MTHLTLNALCVRTRLYQPSCVGRSQATPIYEGQPERSGCWFDVSSQNVLVIHRIALLHALKNQMVLLCRFDQFMFAQCASRPNLYGERFQTGDTSDHFE